MMKRNTTVSLALVAMVVLGGLGGLTGHAGADNEPNNDIASAELISPGTHSGVLNISNNPNDLLDYYKFNLTAGQIIGFDLRCGNLESGSVKFTMYRPNGTQYQASDLLAPQESQKLQWMTNNAGAGQWYIRAEGPNNYSFDLSFAAQDDAQIPGDAGDDFKTSRAIEPNATYSGQEGDDDIADFYSFEAKAGQSLKLGGEVISGLKQGNITLYGVDKQALGSIDIVDPDPPHIERIIKATGTYFIGVEAGNCQYLLNLTLKGGDVPDIRIPSVTMTSPINGTTVGNASFDLTGTASDDIGVASVEVSLSGIAWWTANGTANWTLANLTIGEGVNTIYARATDYSGKQNITWITLAYVPGGANDIERPQVFVTSPANGTIINASTFNLSGTASDNFAVFKVEVSLSAIEWWMAEGTESWKYAGLTIGEGITPIWVRATDFAGNANITWIQLAYIPGGANDTERPQVLVTSPANGTTLNVSTFDLVGTATDNFGVAKVEVSLSAIVWWRAAGTANWSFRLTIGEGISSIWVKATDFAGNYNITWITLAYDPGASNDTQYPKVWVTCPANGTTLNASTFDLVGTASDDYAVFKVEVSLSGIAWWLAAGTLNWTYPWLMIGEGINSIWVKATDYAGKSTLIWVELAYVPGGANDTLKPNVTILSPAQGTISNSSTINLTGAASDNYGVFKVEVSLNNNDWLLARGTEGWSYSNLRIYAGRNTVYVKATDFANNSNVTQETVIFNPGKAGDTVQPTVTISGPKNNALFNKDKLSIVSGFASDNIAILDVELKVNGISVPVNYTSGIWTATDIKLREGKNTLAVTATDYAGNTKAVSVSVIYEKPKPQPGFEAPVLLAVLSIAAVLLARKKIA